MKWEVLKVLWRFFRHPTSSSAFDLVMLASRTMGKDDLEAAVRYLQSSVYLVEKLDRKAVAQ